MRVSAILAGSLLLTGCAETAIGPEGEGPATVAEIVCEADGSTTVLTPNAVVQADGIHIHLVSHLDEPAEIIGLGRDVEPGETEWVSHAPPGTVDTGCNPFSQHGPNGEQPDMLPLEILDPEGIFVGGEIECTGGSWGSTSDFAELPRDAGPVPLDVARAAIKGLQQGDEVLYTGYPEQAERTVAVRRDGKIVAKFDFVTFDGDEWYVASSEGCSSSGLEWS
jgi:hypothetical protein